MIEGRVRELVADVTAASDAWSARERIDAIAELEAAVAMLQAVGNVEAVTYVGQRRTADKTARTCADTAGRGAPVELAMARGVSRATVDYQLVFARQLVGDHPALLAACLDGQVGQSAAKHIVAATEPLTPEQRLAIDAELAELACELTPGEVRKAAGRKVAATDPHAAGKRVAAARARKAVRAIMHGDGTGNLTALLPAEQAVAAWQTLDHEARCRRADGDDRSIDHLMCDLLVERVTGQTAASDLNLEVGVVIAASSLLAADQQPAKLVGHRGGDHGVLPAGLARQLAHHPSSAGATHTNPLHHVTGHTASSSNSTPTHSPSNTPADTTDNPTRPDAEQGPRHDQRRFLHPRPRPSCSRHRRLPRNRGRDRASLRRAG